MRQLFQTRLSKKSSGARWFAKPLDREGHWDIQLVLPKSIDLNYSPFSRMLFDDGLERLFDSGHRVYFTDNSAGLVESILSDGFEEVIV